MDKLKHGPADRLYCFLLFLIAIGRMKSQEADAQTDERDSGGDGPGTWPD